MRIDIRGDKIEVTEGIKCYIEEKIGKLDRYFTNPEELKAFIVIRARNNKEIIEVTVPTPKFTLRAEESHDDLYAATDLVSDKLERQLRKNKTKLRKRFKNVLQAELNVEEDVEENNSTIVKRKLVELIPMDEEEAILQMELLDHDFYLFKDVNSNKVTVLYKRKDGLYGTISEE